MTQVFRTFEECLPEIDVEIRKRRNKWTLTAISWMDYNDIGQIIRLHIYKKWALYDQSKPLANWVNTVISSQIKNLIRNNYSNFARPCRSCPSAYMDNQCLWTPSKTQCSECPIYAKWEKSKKSAYNTKIPLSIEDHSQEVFNKQDDFYDMDEPIKRLNHHMKLILKPNEWRVYEMIYIKHMNEEEAAIKMGFKTKEVNRSPGYKQIKNIKKSIIEKAKKILLSNETDVL